MARDDKHPDWCAQGHCCTAGSAGYGGEHRSQPVTLESSIGTVIATRTQRARGRRRDRMEIRLVVQLPDGDPDAQAWTARVLAERLHSALSAVIPPRPRFRVRSRARGTRAAA